MKTRSGYVNVGSPLVKEAVISLENGRQLKIVAENQGPGNILVSRVELNGKQLNRSYLLHEELMKGGDLVYFLSEKPPVK